MPVRQLKIHLKDCLEINNKAIFLYYKKNNKKIDDVVPGDESKLSSIGIDIAMYVNVTT